MVREDRLFRRMMKEGKPEPTLTFTSRVRRVLETLPAQGRKPAARFIPVSAVAVVAFVAFCVFLVNYAGQANRPGGGLPAAGGTETAQPSASASPKTPSFLRELGMASTKSGITQTVLRAGTDGYIMHLEVGYSPTLPTPDTGIKWSLSIDGKPYFTNATLGAAGSYGNQSSDFYEFILPLTDPISGDEAHISFAAAVMDENKTSFQADFTLPVVRPVKVEATGDGMIAFGGKASLKSLFKSQEALIFILDADDDRDNFLRQYYDSHANAGQGRVVFYPEYPDFFQLEVGAGQSEKSAYPLGASQDDLKKALNDAQNGAADDSHRLWAFLEKDGNGKMLVTIACYDPALQAGDKFALRSKEFNYAKDSSDVLTVNAASGYALNVQLHPDNRDIMATADPTQETTPAPTDTPVKESAAPKSPANVRLQEILSREDTKQVEATCTGSSFFGYKASLSRVCENSEAIVAELNLTDDADGSLAKYLEDNGNGSDCAVFTVNTSESVRLSIIDGQGDMEAIKKLFAPPAGKDANAAIFDYADGRVFVKNIFSILQRGEEGRFKLYVVNDDPILRTKDGDMDGLSLISVSSDNALASEDRIGVLLIQPK